MGLLAVSLSLRTFVYAVGVLAWVGNAERIVWVPVWLAVGEASGIGLVWLHYLRNHRIAPSSTRVAGAFRDCAAGSNGLHDPAFAGDHQHGGPDGGGRAGSGLGPGTLRSTHRMVTALLTFGLIFQQAAFPDTVSVWRQTAKAGREALDSLVEVLMTALVPIAIGTTVLAGPLVRLLPEDYAGAGLLLALGIWRAPLLILAFLYQTTLIAMNREAVGVRSLVLAAIGIVPLVATCGSISAFPAPRGRHPHWAGTGSGRLWLPSA